MTDRAPDVEMAAAAHAEELRFECRPEVRVSAHADVPATAQARSERENLPDEVEPGVTYRDVSVRWRAAAWLADDDAGESRGHGSASPPAGYP
jgi:hypothetical protein